MVAIAVEVLERRIPLCTAHPFLDAADEAHRSGQDFKAAALLREAIKRYMIAQCEYRGVPLPESRNPKSVIAAYTDAGFDDCAWLVAIVASCNLVLTCRKPFAALGIAITMMRSQFGNTFSREGGAV